MSRVFTCPPVVIPRNQASCQNLVKSTKLGRITIDSKKAHWIEKKKETKDKRKQKKETKGYKSHKHSLSKASDVVNHKQHFLSSKKVSDESDLLEKSGLTEELDEPQNHLGYLSDGSQNSKKRKRENSPPAVESVIKAASVAGNPLRIRLILKKTKADDTPALPRKDLVCSTSVAKSLSHQDVITSSISCSKVSELKLSTSVSVIAETKKIKKHRLSKEDRYNALFDDWTPPSLCFADDSSSKNDDDDEWLFVNKTQKHHSKAPVKIDEVMNMRLRDSSWPGAQFLAEVGIHSLPYTVPF